MGRETNFIDNLTDRAGDFIYRLGNMAKAVPIVIIPYIKSRIYMGQFRPLFSYLFTEWDCNLGCGYCWNHDGTRKGMSFSTAKSSIDWLSSVGCRAMGMMGGEPLMRPDFTLKVIEYASKKGMYVYLPTNGVLMTKEFIDKAGKAGVSAVNVAVDCIEPKPGLPKSFSMIRPQFEYLVKMRKKYGYIVFLNINITNSNMEDVRKLTEIGNSYGINSDYHVCEMPIVENSKTRMKNLMKDGRNDNINNLHDCSELCIKKENLKEFDRLIDWLIKKNKQGYPMINAVEHLRDMKDFAHGRKMEWNCIAGEKGCFICDDGRLAPCFGMASAAGSNGSKGSSGWGRIWDPRFSREQLDEMKKDCTARCMSTCYYTSSHYHDLGSYKEWLLKNWRL